MLNKHEFYYRLNPEIIVGVGPIREEDDHCIEHYPVLPLTIIGESEIMEGELPWKAAPPQIVERVTLLLESLRF